MCIRDRGGSVRAEASCLAKRLRPKDSVTGCPAPASCLLRACACVCACVRVCVCACVLACGACVGLCACAGACVLGCMGGSVTTNDARPVNMFASAALCLRARLRSREPDKLQVRAHVVPFK
eukprot:7390259-Alexandrium_andersonii.AAC.1